MIEKADFTEELARQLHEYRRSQSFSLPDRTRIRRFSGEVLKLLFPHFGGSDLDCPEKISSDIHSLAASLVGALSPITGLLKSPPESISDSFFAALPCLHEALRADAEALYRGDPAAESIDEVILAYPGFLAIAIYRIAHEFYQLGVPFVPRMMTEYAHQQTGIDIHPGAVIGRSFFIDHGTGLVIGETTRIGSDVKLYQGVTLGALSVDKSLANTKRHPTIEDHVVIYANATILGGETTIGHHSIVGGNVWLTESIPPHSTVYHSSKVEVHSRS